MISKTEYQPDDIFEMTEREDGATVVVALSGELDLATVERVQQRLAELRDAGRAVLLDLDRLTFMDSTGIRLLLTACEDAASHAWTFRVTRGSDRVQQVLTAAGVGERLPYADTDVT
jgi:anti-sigma B factor antagonist